MRKRTSLFHWSVGFLVVTSPFACGGDTAGPRAKGLDQQYWALTLNHHAITMALTPPYNTVQLVATPRIATGAALADTNPTVYTVSDTSVIVSGSGILTAVAPDFGVMVIASHRIGNLTLTDTAYVNVNDVSPVPQFTTLSLQPQPGDSARFSYTGLDNQGNQPFITANTLDTQGNPIPNTRVRFTASDPSFILGGFISGHDLYPNLVKPGHITLVAEAMIYGVSMVDSLVYTIGRPILSFVGVNPSTRAGSLATIGTFQPQDDTVATGATVVWMNQLATDSIDVIFDTPAAAQPPDSLYVALFGVTVSSVDAGNISVIEPVDGSGGADGAGIRARRFLQAGTYPYRSVRYSTTGIIHVLPEFQVP